MSDDEIEVYIYRSFGEEIPDNVQKIIVSEGVQELDEKWSCSGFSDLRQVSLPNGLKKIGKQALTYCINLLEITITNTVQSIGDEAFGYCYSLEKVDFESSSSSPHQLHTIGEYAFIQCESLQAIRLPSSLNFVGRNAFDECIALVEANLSKTCITRVNESAFDGCGSLQTVSLPKTLEEVGDCAFFQCLELVTVVVPLGSKPITIGTLAFEGCVKLANLWLPKDSCADDDSFQECTLLRDRYGGYISLVMGGLAVRFVNFAIHQMCYHHSTTSPNDLRECIEEQDDEVSLVDEFGMTPFHILCSTVEPSLDLLEVLLELLPNQILRWKCANERRPLDYLLSNWVDSTSSLVHRALCKSMIDPLARWGTTSWRDDMQSKVQDILAADDKERRRALLNEAYFALEQYENAEATSILEMALWKKSIGSDFTNGGSKRQSLDRDESRFLSGSDVVIPHVTVFLNMPGASSRDD